MKKPNLHIFFTVTFVLLAQFCALAQIDSLESPELWLSQQNEKGQVLLKKGLEFQKAVVIFKAAHDFAAAQNLSDQFTEISIGYGIALYKNGDLQNSYATLIEVLPKISNEDLKAKAEVNQIIGMNLIFQDKFPEGYKYQMEAFKYYSDIGDSTGLMSVYYDLGANFGSQNQYELALQNYEKGIAIAESLGDTKMTILGITALGGTWASLNNYDKALDYSGKSIELAKSINDNEELGWASINRGYILGMIERYEEAEYFLKQAYDLSFKIENQLLTGYSLEQLADIHIRQDNLESAIESLDGSYKIYNEIGQSNSLKSVMKKYAEIYFKQKDFNKYKSYTDQYMALKDSLYSKEMMESMASLKQDYEIHKLERENQIQLLKKDQELNNAKNYAAIAIFGGAAIILILLLTLMYNRNKSQVEKNTILTEKNDEILRQVDILAASNQDLEKFAYIISHDLKEPLRNINGFTKLLSRSLRNVEGDNIKEYARFIINGTEQMDELLSGLLDYSKINANKGAKENVEVSELVAKLLENFEIQLKEKNCVVAIQDLPEVTYRKTQMSQVFQNLIANAIKFGPDTGNQIEIGFEENCEEYRFFVKDHGIGIDPEYQKNIFVVFQRLHDRGTYSGSGIGLATCKKIVEDHGGRIWVESKANEGSCFFFTVPKKCQMEIDDLLKSENQQAPSPMNIPELVN